MARRATEPKRQRGALPSTEPVAVGVERATDEGEAGKREHGDSYSDISRDDDLVGTPGSHHARPDRRPEEPSESVIVVPEM
jgi:hypothetical protein